MRVSRAVSAGLAVLGSVVLAVSGAVPAVARSGPPAAFAPAADGALNQASHTFAGWYFGVHGAPGVSAEFRVPAVRCTGTAAGFQPEAVMTNNNTLAAAGVSVRCENGSQVDQPFVEWDNIVRHRGHRVSVGDLMRVTVVMSATTATPALEDLTAGHTFRLSMSGASAGAAASEYVLAGDIGNTNPLPVPDFGAVRFTSGSVGGIALGSVSPQRAYDMVNSSNVTQIATGPIGGTGLNAFTTTWEHS
jgi:hypothetical protein